MSPNAPISTVITRISAAKTHGLHSITRVSASFTHTAGLERWPISAVDVGVGADLPRVIAGSVRVIAVDLRTRCDCCRTSLWPRLRSAIFRAAHGGSVLASVFDRRSVRPEVSSGPTCVPRCRADLLAGYKHRVVVYRGCEIAVKALIERAKTRSRSAMTHRRSAFVAVK
jgi:hypothetical protein